MTSLTQDIVSFIRDTFKTRDFIPLHAPVFVGREREYLNECIDSTFVSSVGKFVDRFEVEMARIAGTKFAIAVVNGTEALHVAMIVAGIERGDEVITQPLTFVATANAIAYAGAHHVFVDVDRDTLGLSAEALQRFLRENCEVRGDACFNRISGRRVRACIPVHIFGHACRIDQVLKVCEQWKIVVIEDSAEALGSSYQGKPLGSFGLLGTFSFNGNKTVTCGGGGAITTDNEALARRAKHLTTTAKVPHQWNYVHDEIGYNYRMPNLNAALACAQLECLDQFLENKRELAQLYKAYFGKIDIPFVVEPAECRSNYWLNAVMLPDRESRDGFLRETNAAGVMTRPAWQLMSRLPMFAGCQAGPLPNAEWLEERLVNIPSSVRLK